MEEIKISVITTLFNYERYIGDAVKSFLKQGIPESEMVIVDDASTDNPYRVLQKFQDDRIKVIKLDKNMGYSHAKTSGIKACRGEIIVMLDADDMLTKGSLAIRYKKIKEGFDFVHGPTLDQSGNGKQVESRMWKKWKKNKKWKYVHAQSAMLKKDIHRKIGLYDENLRCKSDREMFARIFHHKFKIGTVGEKVAIYRKHGKQMHRSSEKLKVNDQLQRQVLKLIDKRKTDLSGLKMLD